MGFMAGRAGVFAMRGGGIAGSVATLDETQSAQGPDRGSTKARRVVLDGVPGRVGSRSSMASSNARGGRVVLRRGSARAAS